MGASRPETPRHPAAAGTALALAALAALAGSPVRGVAQVEVDPVLRGRALVGDTALTRGMIVLHHLSIDSEGEEIDSVSVAADGSFSFSLPNVPDPARQDVFLASVRHDGVLYFGGWVTEAIQLDSLYTIQTYDTASAPDAGADLALLLRTVFIEADADRWRVTDLFRIQNPMPRTLVGREGAPVWRYPLPEGAADFQLGHGETAPDATAFENGFLEVRASLPPGEKMVVVRYWTEEPFFTIPTPGSTDNFELLVREPAPPLEVDGLARVGRTSIEEGTTYVRFSAADLQLPSITLSEGEDAPGAPPVEWAAILIAMLLAAVGLYAVRGGATAVPAASPQPEASRRDLLVAVARLDAAFEAHADPSPAERAQYRRRRAELLERILEVQEPSAGAG